jgi:hypothetical protein
LSAEESAIIVICSDLENVVDQFKFFVESTKFELVRFTCTVEVVLKEGSGIFVEGGVDKETIIEDNEILDVVVLEHLFKMIELKSGI